MMDHYIFLLLGVCVLGLIVYSIITEKPKESGESKLLKRRRIQRLELEPEPEPEPEPEYIIEPSIPQIRIVSKTKSELTKDEYIALDRLYRVNFTDKGVLETSLKTNSRIFIAYDEDNRIVGQAAILVLDQHDIWGAFSNYRTVNVDTNTLILYNVCVDSSVRRKGVGKHLINAVHQWALANNRHSMVLFVDPNNSAAIALYEGFGYNKDKSHYAPPPAEMMMRLRLVN